MQLKIVFIVWIWANISLHKSILECLHSFFLALKPAHLSAFEMIAAGRRHFANEISVYLVIHPLCFHSILFHPHPLFSVLKPLKIIGVRKSHFFKSLSDFANLLTELYTHVKIQTIEGLSSVIWQSAATSQPMSAHVTLLPAPLI